MAQQFSDSTFKYFCEMYDQLFHCESLEEELYDVHFIWDSIALRPDLKVMVLILMDIKVTRRNFG